MRPNSGYKPTSKYRLVVRCHICAKEIKARRLTGYMIFVAIHKPNVGDAECIGSRHQELCDPPYRTVGPILIDSGAVTP